MKGEGRDGQPRTWAAVNAPHRRMVEAAVLAIRAAGFAAAATPEGEGTPYVLLDGAAYLAPDIWVYGSWGLVAVEVKVKRRPFRSGGDGRWHLGCDEWSWREYGDLERRGRVPIVHVWSPGDVEEAGSVVASGMASLVPALRGGYTTKAGTVEPYVGFAVLDREGVGTVGTWKRYPSVADVPWGVLIDEADDLDNRYRLSREAARPSGHRLTEKGDYVREVVVRDLFPRRPFNGR